MVASNQIFLVMDADTPVAAFSARQELHALGQSRDAEHHDHVGGVGGMNMRPCRRYGRGISCSGSVFT
jgi:hypothetical protein